MNTKKIKYPSDNCDEACFYHCTKGGQQEPECVVIKNNGWIRIESESDLPKEEIYCFFIEDNSIYTGYYDSQLSRFYCGNQWITRVSYYQKIVEPQPPIY